MGGPGGVLASWHARMPYARESGGRISRRNPIYRSWSRGGQPTKTSWCIGAHSPQCKHGTRNRNADIGWDDHTFISKCPRKSDNNIVPKKQANNAVISPLLANVFLHYVLDKWASWWRKTNAKGDMIIVRYADDFVIGFQYHDEAMRFLTALRKRLSRYELTLHSDKTRLIEFGRFAVDNRRKRGERKPETFDFLGFTHISSKNRRGGFFLRRITVKKRYKKKVKEVKQELKKRMHRYVKETGEWLASVITGHVNYYGVPGNMDKVWKFYQRCEREWFKVLRRRSQKARKLKWSDVREKIKSQIPRPHLAHPFPEKRFWRQRLEVGAG